MAFVGSKNAGMVGDRIMRVDFQLGRGSLHLRSLVTVACLLWLLPVAILVQ